ncbi:hypothetical protein P171DRAFT_430978 [Karstenula rhodostoma CBS 690.94]|uniref:Uncharacterized protein n=1 Tax=Karstenula rhodostoma CBS 690.94 TaxID=1392251 RepID=A0A9P4UCT8_9PLEO|nr:hypothetical protein P171DRAFT_430978 [Karstenula rhodostoma CBS 690.94]
MEVTERLVNSPTPPLPVRNPNHRYPPRKAAFAVPNSSAKLIPKPLFSKRSRLSPLEIHIEVQEFPDWSSRSSSQSSGPPSPTFSFTSFASYASSATTVSGPGSIRERPASQEYLFPPSDICNWGNEWEPSHAPKPRLRRIKTPKKETLRDLRAKGSDVCLQRVYEQQLELYLNGALFPRTKWKYGLSCVEEE